MSESRSISLRQSELCEIGKITQSEISLAKFLFDNQSLLSKAHEKFLNGERLTGKEAFLIAELHALIVFLHFIQFSQEIFTVEISGKDRNFSPSIFRTMNFFRTTEFLRAAGLINPESFQSDKLFLGAGTVISDIYPFSISIRVNNLPAIMGMISSGMLATITLEKAREIFSKLQQQEALVFELRPGRIVCVDNDKTALEIGAGWAERVLEIGTKTYPVNARELVHQPPFSKEKFGIVVAARIDPWMIGGDPRRKQTFRNKALSLAESLIEMVTSTGKERRKGQVFFTAGSGDRGNSPSDDYHSWEEYQHRQQALQIIKERLQRLGPVLTLDMAKLPIGKWLYPPVADLFVLVANAGRITVPSWD
ncbi:MAG: hypothetical protein QHH09_03520 [Microgenomates group bacterium]|nr:hypothetical protein [Microgenomates group bacterium]